MIGLGAHPNKDYVITGLPGRLPQGWHFFHARFAPRGPEVDHHHLSLMIGQAKGFPVECGQFEGNGFLQLLLPVLAFQPRPDAEDGDDRQQQGTQHPRRTRAVANPPMYLQIGVGIAKVMVCPNCR
jgi:hypothetical protein